jgi:SAM-dependent methyltransferase
MPPGVQTEIRAHSGGVLCESSTWVADRGATWLHGALPLQTRSRDLISTIAVWLLPKPRFPNRSYLLGAGECLPFADESFGRVISAVALPYMNIQKTLAEIHRILVPGGRLSLILHLPSFTIAELLHDAIPKPVPTLFRLYVLANGLFHCTGWTVGFLTGRTESFSPGARKRVALNRAGFVNHSFSRATGRVGARFLLEASKSQLTGPFAAARAA